MADFDLTFDMDNTFDMSFESGDSNFDIDFSSVHVIEVGHYAPLPDKPQINGETLIGDKSFEDLGDHILTNMEIKGIFDRVFNKGGN